MGQYQEPSIIPKQSKPLVENLMYRYYTITLLVGLIILFLLEIHPQFEDEIQDKIIVKSNENTSVGEWSSILGRSLGQMLKSMCKQGLQIPSCEFKNKACSIYLNEGTP